MDKVDLNKVITQTQNKILVRTDFACPSGQGTAMHSKTGKSTIP